MERTPPTPASVVKAAGMTESTSASSATPITTNINSSHRTQIAKRLKPFEFDTQSPEKQQPLVMDSETVAKLFQAINDTKTSVKESAKDQMVKLDEVCHNISSRFVEVETAVTKVSEKVDKHEKDIEYLKRHANDIDQEKFSSHMEIVGIPKSEIDAHLNDMKSFVAETITSFGIQFDPSVILQAFPRTVEKTKMHFIVVILSTIEAKIFIMKKKRESQDPRKIFFGHRLTPLNRAIFTKSRQAAKQIGGSAFIHRGRIFVARGEEKRRICSMNEADTISSLFPIPPTSGSSEMTA
jgi:hypothetical protein